MPHLFQGPRSGRWAMRILLPWIAASLSWPALAHAEDALMLRIRQTHATGANDYELLDAARGNFQVKPPLREPQTADLVVVGRDGQGRELFRRAVRNPGIHRAEIFDPATGQIDFARDIQRSGGVVELHVPDAARLASVDLFERPAKSDTGARAHRLLIQCR